MTDSYSLVLPFDSDEPEFTRGFEAGRMWERIKDDRADWSQIIHATNAEMVMRMCDAEARAFRAEVLDETWVKVYIS